MKVLTLLAAAVLLVGCGGNGDGDASPETPRETQPETAPQADPDCGATTIDGVPARVFCGEAELEIDVGGEATTFDDAECEIGDGWVQINAGTLIVGDPAGGVAPDYVGITLGNHPHDPPDTPAAPAEGTYEGGLMSFSLGGQVYLVQGFPSFTLENDRHDVEFTAVTAGGEDVSGSFSCPRSGA